MPEQIPELTPVSSSHLDAVGYDEDTQILYVQWKGGEISAYENVPAVVASDFQKAPSPGKAFNSMIRDKYQHHYVES